MIVNREQGREHDRQQGKREGNMEKGRGGEGMHRFGKKGTYISHKHHRLLLEGNKGREKREGKAGREWREGNTLIRNM